MKELVKEIGRVCGVKKGVRKERKGKLGMVLFEVRNRGWVWWWWML